jgi:hypothetical protein
MFVLAMSHPRAWVPLTVLVMLITTGCGRSADASRQAAVIAYQNRVGVIDKPFAKPTNGVARAITMLEPAIVQYDGLKPPAALRARNTAMIRGLRGELRSLRAATRAVAAHEPGALTAAEALGTRSRAATRRALASITAFARVCDTHASRC